LSTKIHALVDALGNPLGFIPTPGQAHDLEGADALLPDMAAEVLLADQAFDADERVIEPLRARGKSFVIPPKSNRKVQRDFDRMATRHAISSRTSSASSRNIAQSLPVTTKPPEIFSPQFISRLLSIDDRP
jgi:transposase